MNQLPAQSAVANVLPQQPLRLSNAVLESAAQFRSAVDTAAVGNSPPAGRTTPAAGLLGVAFSPASDVSQLSFSGSFANYSY